MIQEHRIDQIIRDFDQERMPKLHSTEEQEVASLVHVLKQAGQKNLDPDVAFIHSLESKLLKGGDYSMSNWLEKIMAKPWLLAGVGVVVLFIVSSTVSLPMMPFGMMSQMGESAMDSTVTVNSIAGGSMGYSGRAARDEKMMMAPSVEPMPAIYPGGSTGDGSSIVKNASMDLEVKDVNKTVGEVSSHIESVGGVVTNSSVNKSDEGYNAYLSLRVPAGQFQATVNYLRELSQEVISENISSYDQSPQVDNTQDQLSDLRKELTKYQSLLKEAVSADEKLNIQSQIDRVEREIRDWERQSQNLEGNEQYSFITLSLREKAFKLPVLEELGLGQTVSDAIFALKRFVLWLVVLGIWGIVFAPIWVPVYWVIRKKNKK